MATFDKTGCGPLNGAVPFDGTGKCYVASAVIDLTGNTMVSGDVYQCLALPAKTLVRQVRVEIISPAVGTALTGNVGDGTGASGWDSGINLAAGAGTVTTSLVGTDSFAAAATLGKYYGDADSIDITLATVTAITAGPKFRISAMCVDYS